MRERVDDAALSGARDAATVSCLRSPLTGCWPLVAGRRTLQSPSPSRWRDSTLALSLRPAPASIVEIPSPHSPTVLGAARRLAERWDIARRIEPFEPQRWRGGEDAIQLQLDDVSGIPFLDGIAGVAEYQHRARLRARDGDLFVTTTPQRPGEEDYYRERLGLGSTVGMLAGAPRRPLELAAACSSPPLFEALASSAANAGAVVLHPFMGIEAVWELAASLAEASRARIEVLAPPPPVTWIANDKAAFCDLVVDVLGRDWVAAERRSRDPEALARGLLELGESSPRVALKRLRCASAMGNRVFDSAELRAGGFAATLEMVERFLTETRWSAAEEVQAVAWEQTELSPSTQWWIPPLSSDRSPHLDGIYEQILVGPGKVFAGSRPSALPATVHRDLAAGGAAVASLLQRLGYVGRCSFDHLVVGDPDGEHQLRFTECNGRWGGTSTPMHLVDRLFGPPAPGDPARDPSPRRRSYQAMGVAHPTLAGLSFRELLSRVGDSAYDRRSGSGSFLFYNVGPLDRHGKLDVVALGGSPEESAALLGEELPRLLGGQDRRPGRRRG